VVVSNVAYQLAHQDYVTVHLCIKSFLAHLTKLRSVKKIYYFSDGAAGQCKNKYNFMNKKQMYHKNFYFEK
jgi:hypothetical protein